MAVPLLSLTVVKAPPAYRLAPDTARALTVPLNPVFAAVPPTRAQVVPSHWAMRFTVMLVPLLLRTVVKAPPAYNMVPLKTSAFTVLPKPVAVVVPPIRAQLEPFHCAMRLTVTPPAVVKEPPA